MSVTKTDKEVRFIQTTSADYSAQTEIISDAIYFLTDTKEIYVGATKYSQSVNLKNGTGTNSVMMLIAGNASGSNSHAEGDSTEASGDCSHAEGERTRAGQQAFTITNWAPGEGANGTFTLSSVTGLTVGKTFSVLTRDDYSIVNVGKITSIDTAKNQIAVTTKGDIDRLDNAKYLFLWSDPSLGDTNIGEYSHAEGYTTTAVGVASHAEGINTIALGYASHVEGETSTALGYASHAEGYTMVSGNYSHAEGIYAQAGGDYSHAEGKGARTGRKVFSVTDFSAESKRLTLSSVKGLAIGQSYSLIIEGNCILHCGNITSVDTTNNTITVDDCPPNVANGSYIFTTDDPNLGDHTLGEGAHAEGESSEALEDDAHAEGYSTTASGTSSHSEGMFTEASGNSAHAEGSGTTASGYRSHAEGNSTTASGRYSHAEGRSTVAASSDQHVQGKYNVEDSSGEYADIIGNGTADDNRSNAHTVDWSGNAWYAGDVYVGSTSGTNKDAGSKKLATEEYVDSASITPTIGDNGNWYLGDTDTGKPSRGDTGPQGLQGEKGDTGATGPAGADGKSAYQYAQEGGYTGTESEFAAKLAEEIHPGSYPVVTMTADTAALAPNTYYKWGEVASLTITLADPTNATITNEYCFEFVSGEAAATLTVPSDIKWVQEPTIEAGKTYQVSILNGIGVICGA